NGASSGEAKRRSAESPKPSSGKASPRQQSESTEATSKARKAPKKSTDPRVARRIQRAHRERQQQKDLSTPTPAGDGKPSATGGKDRLVLMVRDPYWLHAYWELTSGAIERAKAAMAEQWHTARPVLRLLHVATGNTTSASERVVRDIEIHGGVQNWYIDVADP